jgi:hypothetical protein
MVLYNKKQMPSNWGNYSNCIDPNFIRKIYTSNKFKKKYPFGTIHFLLCVLGSTGLIKNNLSEKAISILLYVHGTVKKLFKYQENCVSWFRFFDAKNSERPLYPIFAKFMNITLADLMRNLKDIILSFNQIDGSKTFGGDKIKILDIKNNVLQKQSIEQIENFVRLLAQNTGWAYVPEKWGWTNLNVCEFSKEMD